MKNTVARIKELFIKHREIISYLFFGGLTTLVNFGAYAFFHDLLALNKILSEALAWFVSVLFAFVTNKNYVFNDKSATLTDMIKKLFSFFSFRAITGALDIILFALFHLYINDYLLKIIISVIVIIVNYVFSKLFIFRKKAVQ